MNPGLIDMWGSAATHIVIASPIREPVFFSRLSASLRTVISVCKALILTITAVDDNHGVAYTLFYWVGIRAAPLMDFGATDLTGYGGAFDEDDINSRYYHHHSGDGMYEDDFGYYEVQDVDEGFAAFCGSIVRQVWPNIWISLVACLVWRGCRGLFRLLLSSTTTPNYLPQIFEALLNAISMLLGIVLLRHFFGDLYVRPCAFVFTVGAFLAFNTMTRGSTACGDEPRKPTGWTSQMVFVTVCCLLLQLYCEFFMNPREWHMIRGTAMVLAMKAISVAAPRSPHQQSLQTGFLQHYLAWCGYAFSPGSVIFGPWFGFESYLHGTQLIDSSSVNPGLNFQLAAVLFSIGIYAYIDFRLRARLSAKWSACIGARACPNTCNHRNRANRWWVRGVNVLFSGLAIFHLAYLAVMFDTSEEQDKGYNMLHVLEKWSSLNFLSHIVAGLTYALCFLI
ncbi:Protein-serine O-palmitoleoyltransferase porcupine [Taenia solium]|eukprot:TsM_000587900 transcript=TsM_000587900 gene=TsM_000587900